MNSGKYVFSQLVAFISHNDFNRCVARYEGNLNVRTFRCWHQLLCLIFGQLTHRESLRDIVTCLRAQGGKLFHLGFPKKVSRSTFADANEKRNWRIYADFAQTLMGEARELYRGSGGEYLERDQRVYALDSSLIRMCISVFPWASYRKTTAGVKIHTLLDIRTYIPVFICITDGRISDMAILNELRFEPDSFYVMDRGYWDLTTLSRIASSEAFFLIRARRNFKYRRQYSNPRGDYPNISADQTGVLSVPSSRKLYPGKLRRIKAKDPETGSIIVLTTNNFELNPATIADLYRQRWKIELFFKWIKQHLRIRVFWGTSENAVKTQIWSAISTYLLVAIMKKRLGITQNLYEILQILSVSAFDKVPLNQLLNENGLQKAPTENPNQLKMF